MGHLNCIKRKQTKKEKNGKFLLLQENAQQRRHCTHNPLYLTNVAGTIRVLWSLKLIQLEICPKRIIG